jgi:hypothetical protein
VNGPAHYRAAENAAEASAWAYQRWGESGDGSDFKAAMWEQGMARLNATLALAAATAQLLGLDGDDDWKQALT